MQVKLWKLFAGRLAGTLALAILVLGTILYQQNSDEIALNKSLHLQKIEGLQQAIQNHFRLVSRDMTTLAHAKAVKTYANDPKPETLEDLQQYFVHYAETSRRYDQIRLLSPTGFEVVRVNYRDLAGEVVDQAHLQDKSDRYYFSESIKLPPQVPYVSPIDLNEELGFVELPHKPVMRIGYKIYDTNTQLIGILVLNMLVEPVIHELEQVALKKGATLELIDQDGYWLFDSKGEHNWSNQLHDGLKFADLNPTLWSRASKLTQGQFQQDQTYVTLGQITYPHSNAIWQGYQHNLYLISRFTEAAPLLSTLNGLTVSGLLALFSIMVASCWFWGKASYEKHLTAQKAHSDAIRFEKTIETALDGMIVISHKGVIIDYNKAAEEIFGYTKDETIGSNISMLVPMPDRAKHDDYLDRYHQEREARVINRFRELRAERKDGEQIDIQLAVSEMVLPDGLYYVGSIVDITRRKNIERDRFNYQKNLEDEVAKQTADLRLINQRLNMAVDNGSLGIWEYSFADDKLIWNKCMHSIYGTSADAFTGSYQDWADRLHPDDLSSAETAFKRAVEGFENFNTVFRILRPSGELRYVKATATVVLDDAGKPARVIGINRDITEETVAQETLKEGLAMARDASNTKSHFLATMSHEIRTPISGVVGMAEALIDDAEDHVTREKIRLIYKSGNALLRIINDILDFSRLEEGKLELTPDDFDLEDQLTQVTRVLESTVHDKGIYLNTTIGDNIPARLKGDATRLRQILYNLVGNAVKFTKVGGVSLSLYRLPSQDGSIRVKFSIRDTGIGVSEEAKTLLFHRFQQANASINNKYGGSGLGLSICKELAELMGGEIGFDSEEHVGSTFWFILPFEEASPLAETPPATNSQAPVLYSLNRSLHILLVDDNHIIQTITKQILTQLGHQVEVVGDGYEALKALGGDTYDLVILDKRMPNLDGTEVAKTMRKSEGYLADMPIIGFTADAVQEQVQAFYESGIDHCITKPANRQDLVEAINQVMHSEIHTRRIVG